MADAPRNTGWWDGQDWHPYQRWMEVIGPPPEPTAVVVLSTHKDRGLLGGRPGLGHQLRALSKALRR